MPTFELFHICPGCGWEGTSSELIKYEPEACLKGGRCPECKYFLDEEPLEQKRFEETWPAGGRCR